MFQRRVLLAALELLNVSEGPVLVDFAEESPGGEAGSEYAPQVWACPVRFASGIRKEPEPDLLRSTFEREIRELRPWYDLSLEKRGRTTVTDFAPEDASEFLAGYAFERTTEPPKADMPLAVALRLAAHDLKAFYLEAVTARPGSASPSSAELNRWFWAETAAGHVLRAVKERCVNEDDKALRKTGAMLLVPMDQA